MDEFDIAIVGGGLTGGSLACALSGWLATAPGRSGPPTRVALLEATPPPAPTQPCYDERVIALSWGSRRILEGLGLWADIAPEAEPILRVHVSERGGCGITRLDREEVGVAALGYVTPARAIGAALGAALSRQPHIQILRPARLVAERRVRDGIELDLDSGATLRRLHTRLLVAADGGDSSVRERLGLRARERDYAQDAVICTVTPDRPRRGMAFERFTDSGPLALLPMTQGRYSVVWTCATADTADLLTRTDEAFLAALQGRFGYRLGGFGAPSPRRAFPLKLQLAMPSARDRVVLIGNAAHALHPVAGQGFNLGLRDVAALAEALVQGLAAGADPGGPAVLDDYRRWRGQDQAQTALITDTLVYLFTNPWGPLRLARQAGLLGLDTLGPPRRVVARRFMGVGGGLGGRLPRLARGLTLEHPLG